MDIFLYASNGPRLLKVHGYRTARIQRPAFRFVSEYDDVKWNDPLARMVAYMVDEWFAIAFAQKLIPSRQGDNHIVFEFEGGLLAAYSDYSLTIGTGLLLGDW